MNRSRRFKLLILKRGVEFMAASFLCSLPVDWISLRICSTARWDEGLVANIALGVSAGAFVVFCLVTSVIISRSVHAFGDYAALNLLSYIAYGALSALAYCLVKTVVPARFTYFFMPVLALYIFDVRNIYSIVMFHAILLGLLTLIGIFVPLFARLLPKRKSRYPTDTVV